MTTYTILPPVKSGNYLNNRDILREIHLSKNSYCQYDRPEVADYDIILTEEQFQAGITPEIIEDASARRLARLGQKSYDEALAAGQAVKPQDFVIDTPPLITDLVFRVMTYQHIPLSPGRKKTPRRVADHHVKVNFHPFKHYQYDQKGDLVEVGRSHFRDGVFSPDSGTMTVKLSKMLMLLVHRISQSSNWRNYTYLDEMRAQALVQLSQMGLQFDEHRSDNPFSYYTVSITNSFTRIFNIEKRNQRLRDDLLINNGALPSFTRQLELEEEHRRRRERVEIDQAAAESVEVSALAEGESLSSFLKALASD